MVCSILEKLGYPVFYADLEAKKAMHEDPLLKSQVIALLGPEAYRENELNRPFVAEKIFNDPALRQAMDQIVHPAVYRAYDRWKAAQASELVFNESALLFETGSYQRFDATILVTADLETRIHRVMQRDKVTRDQVLARMQHQLPDEAKQSLTPHIITNDSTQLLIPQILQIIAQLK